MKMTVVITMAGLGSRFRKAGYKVPKYRRMAELYLTGQWKV